MKKTPTHFVEGGGAGSWEDQTSRLSSRMNSGLHAYFCNQRRTPFCDDTIGLLMGIRKSQHPQVQWAEAGLQEPRGAGRCHSCHAGLAGDRKSTQKMNQLAYVAKSENGNAGVPTPATESRLCECRGGLRCGHSERAPWEKGCIQWRLNPGGRSSEEIVCIFWTRGCTWRSVDKAPLLIASFLRSVPVTHKSITSTAKASFRTSRIAVSASKNWASRPRAHLPGISARPRGDVGPASLCPMTEVCWGKKGPWRTWAHLERRGFSCLCLSLLISLLTSALGRDFHEIKPQANAINMGGGLLLHRARSTPVLPQREGAWGSISSSQCQQSPCPATLCLTQAVWAPWGGARHGSASLRQHLSLRFHILWGWEPDRQVCCGAGRWEGSGRREPSGDPSDGWDTIPSRNGYRSRSESQGDTTRVEGGTPAAWVWLGPGTPAEQVTSRAWRERCPCWLSTGEG
ncbi:PREDICTED: uncharacterized protein LOC108535278 isoform X2 [Rhinopithecus bieti]|uniref:uncharacterized protein LOC108535278 isoform X2 n=1 Tax=Rhinopithecus bieti TaxID=61621 RepID=UPI00083BBCF9|nr:PREDICTED: uncharacterized protein LOC108535278 isoform X2 [Rhinopithecus bieti]